MDRNTEIAKINPAEVLSVQKLGRLASLENAMAALKKEADELKKELLAAMEAHNVLKLDVSPNLICAEYGLTVTRVAPTTRETLDTKTLKAELPDVYDAYVKISPVAGSVRVKLYG